MIPLLACAEPPPAVPIPLVSGPELADGSDTPLARRLRLETGVPTSLTLEVDSADGGFDVAFPGTATAWDVPVLGLKPDREWTVRARIAAEDGRVETLGPLTVVTEPLPASFPVVEEVRRDPERSVGGYWLFAVEIPDGGFWLAIVDLSDVQIAWLYAGPVNFGDARMTGDGTILGLFGAAIEMDLTGDVLRYYAQEPQDEPGAHRIPWSLNHELHPVADGSFWSIATGSVEVPAYPQSYADPTPAGPARVADARLVRFGSPADSVDGFGEDATVEAVWPLSERLDTARIGFDALAQVDAGYDWVHANAVISDPAGGVVVAVRHQDCLVRLDPQGDVDWILGDPAGWSPSFADALLEPAPGTVWPYHLHGPDFDADGRLWVFDNRTVEATPYAGLPPQIGESRVVAYAIEGRTVEQVAEWKPPVALRSNALGNVRVLGEDRVLVDFGLLLAEGDVRNVDAGRGANHARVMEIDPADPEPIVDLRIWTPRDVEPSGVNVYRAVHVPSLYPRDVSVTVRQL